MEHTACVSSLSYLLVHEEHLENQGDGKENRGHTPESGPPIREVAAKRVDEERDDHRGHADDHGEVERMSGPACLPKCLAPSLGLTAQVEIVFAESEVFIGAEHVGSVG